MLTVRPLIKLDWFDLIDLIEESITQNAAETKYFDIIDEIYMRKVESISEGATYKMKKPTKQLWDHYQQRMNEDPNFSTTERSNEFARQAKLIIN